MVNNSLYNAELWQRFRDKYGITKTEFKLKKYPQFDPYFDFFQEDNLIQKLVSDSSLKGVSSHPFIPFIKILTKTPRYKYQESKESFSLETKIRPISFASHFDSYIYSFYAYALTEKYQEYIKGKAFSDCVLAYRSDLDGKCNIQFAKEAFERVNDRIVKSRECTAIALDITGYFDNIDHFLLKEKWCKILGLSELPIDQYKVYRSLTRYSYVNYKSLLTHFKINLNYKKKQNEKWQSLLDLIDDTSIGNSFLEKFNYLRDNKLIVTNLPKKNKLTNEFEFRGIPQGSSMSAVLSNIYLIDFDEHICNLSIEHGFTYRRYCDDLLIICEPAQSQMLTKLVVDEIKKYSLVIQDRKAEQINFHANKNGAIRGFNHKKITKDNIELSKENEGKFYKNLQYLGFEFNGQNIYVRPGSLSRYFRKMKGRIVKTIMMSYSSHSKKDKVLKKQIFERYSHVGKRNFLSYVRNAASKEYTTTSKINREGLNSLSIKRQIASHFRILEKEILKTSEQRFLQKENINEIKKLRGKRLTKNIYKT